jgi:hypothetical protein
MKKKTFLLSLILIFMVTGCVTHRERQEQEVWRDFQSTKIANQKLQEVGVSYGDYYISPYKKNNDVDGYILDYLTKESARKTAYEERFNAALPSIRAVIRKCVVEKGIPSDVASKAFTCLRQLPYDVEAPLRDDVTGTVPVYKESGIIAPIIQELQPIHDEETNREWTEIVYNQRRIQQQQIESQKAAKKRAYDKSIQSLIKN